jgi:hypothetical protein
MTFLCKDIPLDRPQVNGHILRIYLAFLGQTKSTHYNLYRISCAKVAEPNAYQGRAKYLSGPHLIPLLQPKDKIKQPLVK